MISSPNYGQKLNGKWILKEVGYKEFKKNPGLQILNFKNESNSMMNIKKFRIVKFKSKPDETYHIGDKRYGQYRDSTPIKLYADAAFYNIIDRCIEKDGEIEAYTF